MTLIISGLVPGVPSGTLVVKSNSPVDAALAANIPAAPIDGQTHRIIGKGNFEGSALITPVNQVFEIGDYMRFDTSLLKWTFLVGNEDINDEAFGGSWNGDENDAPSRNSLFDKLTSMDTAIAGKMVKAANLGDVVSVPTSRTNLGVLSEAEIDFKINNLSSKSSVLYLAAGNLNLTGVESPDGTATTDNERVACFLQTVEADRGFYDTSSGGAWTRTADFAVNSDVGGATFFVQKGTANGDKGFAVDQDDPDAEVGVDTLTVTVQAGGGGGGSPASESTAGIAELATQAEKDAGTDDLRIVTPLKLKTVNIQTSGAATVTVLSSNRRVRVDTTSQTVDVDMPDVNDASISDGQEITIKDAQENSEANNVSINPFKTLAGLNIDTITHTGGITLQLTFVTPPSFANVKVGNFLLVTLAGVGANNGTHKIVAVGGATIDIDIAGSSAANDEASESTAVADVEQTIEQSGITTPVNRFILDDDGKSQTLVANKSRSKWEA